VVVIAAAVGITAAATRSSNEPSHALKGCREVAGATQLSLDKVATDTLWFGALEQLRAAHDPEMDQLLASRSEHLSVDIQDWCRAHQPDAF
jgi:hypothetical protein